MKQASDSTVSSKSRSAAANAVDKTAVLVDAGDGKKVIVREIKTTQLHNGGFDNQTSDITINYDRAMEVPAVIHADVATAGGNETNSASYVFTLEKDSFVKPAH